MLPSEYYEGTELKERVFEPCQTVNLQNSTCVDLLYPPLPVASRVDAAEKAAIMEEKKDGTMTQTEKVSLQNV